LGALSPAAALGLLRLDWSRIDAMSLLKWAFIMLIVSLVRRCSACLAAASADVARVLFYIFLVIFLILRVLALTGARALRGP
jgi:uncharacterized membrane protein YtjA (UPF0391 family)